MYTFFFGSLNTARVRDTEKNTFFYSFSFPNNYSRVTFIFLETTIKLSLRLYFMCFNCSTKHTLENAL